MHVGLKEFEVTVPHRNPGGHYRYFNTCGNFYSVLRADNVNLSIM